VWFKNTSPAGTGVGWGLRCSWHRSGWHLEGRCHPYFGGRPYLTALKSSSVGSSVLLSWIDKHISQGLRRGSTKDKTVNSK
jgi:hypothetical protein